ncbi:2-amino-4-hydroxy-6-hydroxymethyldihydropteridine diphosphokinase [Micropruina sp.]|uniref:2-amino-4-hydroxy-6- hydroxymethyldihydropteridine diphosphokinase n=1 Tax=Micropruina sp. TaxID=2737536 RepID=UPI002609C964|nr:2-amino-4-hydroxy-6-hydroxymethyldihydropteridine diphosphokinase [Micropruina sp.]
MTDFNPNAHLDFDVDTLSGMVPIRQVVFSIGSNLGDRLAYLQGAVDLLRNTPTLSIADISPVYETAPVGPVEEQPDFLNIIVRADSTLASLVLLERAQAIEKNFLRTREVPGGARTLDVDLITVGDRIKETPELTLPHPRAHQRAFVLVPWLDIDPDAALPALGRVAELLRDVDTSGVRRRDDLVIDL